METMEKRKLRTMRTMVSQAYWCSLQNGQAQFDEASIPLHPEAADKRVFWFDELLKGGIVIPKSGKNIRPLTLLITGPPGSGKTTLALEICYRLAEKKGGKKFSLYISTDSESHRIKANAEDLGYKNVDEKIIEFEGKIPTTKMVTVWGSEKIKERIDNCEKISDIVDCALEDLIAWFKLPSKTIKKWIKKYKKHIIDDPITSEVLKVIPDILVIDNLNGLEKGQRGDYFQEFLKIVPEQTELVIFILDSGSSTQEFWEFVCDIIVHLDYTTLHDYYLRTIEIVKARYQPHVWGKHQLKIYSKQGPDRPQKMRRDHPYRKEGGIFIYPSIHYYLSHYKKLSQAQTPQVQVIKSGGISHLPEKLTVELPQGRCTAFIGGRGAHKSYLGYRYLLSRIINDPNSERGLVISLQDDELLSKTTMGNILQREFDIKIDMLSAFESDDKLEILYYHPGYITPEEFFHRMFMSIHRLKTPGKNLTVLFNSLDQLFARFPLCANQDIFVPAIINCLTGEGATSIFIAVDEPEQPVQQYGLLPMADLIISFYPYQFPKKDYCGHLKRSRLDSELREEYFKDSESQDTVKSVVLQVVRFAGGQGGGAAGLLEMIDQGELNESPYLKAGLQFTPLSPHIKHGDLISSYGPWVRRS